MSDGPTAGRGPSAQFVFIVAISAGFGAFSVAEAGVITWSGNTFIHGVTPSVGWAAGAQSGSTVDAATGVTMTATHARVNSTAGPNNMSLQPFGGPAGSPTFLYWAITSDYTQNVNGNPPGTPTDYSTMTLSFSSAVTVTGFAIRDVDDGTNTSWQDFVAVRASNVATNVGVTYTLGDNGNNQDLHTRHGLNGVLGVNNLNYASTDPNAALADVGTNFGGAITTMTITFLQGPQGSSAANHLIFLSNLTITQAPEASSFSLVGIAAGIGGLIAWRKIRKSPVV